MPEHNFRVRIAIYDDVESTAEEPFLFIDEPLYSAREELEAQARRAFDTFLNQLQETELDQ